MLPHLVHAAWSPTVCRRLMRFRAGAGLMATGCLRGAFALFRADAR